MDDHYPDTYRHPLPNGHYYDMVRVRPGMFVMGSEGEEAFESEKPEHLVRLSQDYYIGAYPVTQAIWKTVMDGHNPARFHGDGRPVESISWQDIVEGGQDEDVPEGFLLRLNQKFPVAEPALAGFEFRLPTEAEWEYAAKDGHKTAIRLEKKLPQAANLYTLFAGGDQLKEVGWYALNSHRETKSVRGRMPNELGLYDMCGNVWEWCQDWYDADYYKACKEEGVKTDPRGPDKGLLRVSRGGSWINDPRFCRVSYRDRWHPANRHGFIGFRLVLAPSSAEQSSGVEWQGGAP